MTVVKVIIPMAGLGKRLKGLTLHRPKALVRLADRRLLDHVLDAFTELAKTYALEYIFITGPHGDQIKEHMQAEHPEKKVTYFHQSQLLGQSHAVFLAKDAISGPLLLTFCDTINQVDLSSCLEEPVDGIAVVQEVDDPRRHGVAVTDADQLVTRLIEKPQSLEHRAALTGFYFFREGKDLIRAIELQLQQGKSLNNEYYLADAINILISNGKRIRTVRTLQWLDAGTPEALIATNEYLLQQRGARSGNGNTSHSILIPPVYVHEDSRVENSVIGPNVTIGENCCIANSVLKNTIIDDDSTVVGAVLTNSLVGRHCSVIGQPMQAILADHTKAEIDSAKNGPVSSNEQS
jgi:glucose-1-phosphate thymidylyltransferase